MEIVGSVKEDQAFARQQSNKDSGVSTNVDNSRLEDDAPEEYDGQRRRKRPKKVPSEENLIASFKKHDDDSNLILDSDSDLDEPAQIEPEADKSS